jgi:hypothetical protein
VRIGVRLLVESPTSAQWVDFCPFEVETLTGQLDVHVCIEMICTAARVSATLSRSSISGAESYRPQNRREEAGHSMAPQASTVVTCSSPAAVIA